MFDELKTDRTAKEFAEISFMIYSSRNILNARRQKKFAVWHRLFCRAIGIEYTEYKPNKLKVPDEALKRLFNYLQ
jgi:hypothetical protein